MFKMFLDVRNMKTAVSILVADEAWLGLALLQFENRDRISFSVKEILERIRAEPVSSDRAGVQVHVYLHNVANVAPNSAKYRMFYKLPDSTYRLYRLGDPAHPSRTGKMIPRREDMPSEYHYLLDWYENEYSSLRNRPPQGEDPILQMAGVGKEIWADTNSDDYVRSLRSNWYGSEHRRG